MTDYRHCRDQKLLFILSAYMGGTKGRAGFCFSFNVFNFNQHSIKNYEVIFLANMAKGYIQMGYFSRR